MESREQKRCLERQVLRILIEDEANQQRNLGGEDYRQGYRDGWEKATEYYEAMMETYGITRAIQKDLD